MAESVRREQAPTRGTLDQALLDQERLDDLLDGVAWLRQRGGDCLYPHRSAAVIMRDGGEIAAVHGVETGSVDFKLQQRFVGDGAIDAPVPAHGRKIAHAAKEPARDARRTARAAGDFI